MKRGLRNAKKFLEYFSWKKQEDNLTAYGVTPVSSQKYVVLAHERSVTIHWSIYPL